MREGAPESSAELHITPCTDADHFQLTVLWSLLQVRNDQNSKEIGHKKKLGDSAKNQEKGNKKLQNWKIN